MYKKVLFVHDGPLYQNPKGEYLGIHYNNKIKERYLKLGKNVTFCMRVEKIDETDNTKYSKISPEHFDFIGFRNFKSISEYFKKFKAQEIIEKAVKDCDVLVARMPSASAILAIKIARKLDKPYLVEMVACTYDAYWNYNWKGKIIANYKLWKTQKVLKDCPYVIYVTSIFLQERYPTNGQSIGCSDVELNELSPIILENRLKNFSKNNKPLTLATVAALDIPYKGQADVLEALYQLKKKGLVFKYKLVGQGSPAHLKSIIEKYNLINEVEIVGPLPFHSIFDFFKKIDIYIQPSKQEGLPRALVEAMSMGCPAIGTNVGGIPELLSSDCIYEAGNIEALCTKLESFSDQKLKVEAELNFKKANDFQFHVLERRRTDFYDVFLKETN